MESPDHFQAIMSVKCKDYKSPFFYNKPKKIVFMFYQIARYFWSSLLKKMKNNKIRSFLEYQECF